VRRPLVVAAVTAAALAATGCGYSQPDLFEVQRSGADRNANVTVVVNDGGTVSCDDHKAKALPGKQLLTARDLARKLDKEASLSIELPPAGNSILRYKVTTQTGTIAFSDTSQHRPRTFDRLAAFTKDVVEDICGIER
jgi:hypothetical protein